MPTQTAPLAFIDADLSTLLEAFHSYSSVTSFINWNPIWSSKKNKWLKVPVQRINNPFEHKTLQEASSQSHKLGLVCSPTHPLIALDIDGVPLATPALTSLLQAFPTYSEKSPSNKPNHTRLIYALPDQEDKDKLKKKGSVAVGSHDIELYNASTNFVTLTGQHLSDSPLSITTITADQLLQVFPSFARTNIIDHPTKAASPDTTPQPKAATLVDYNTWLEMVPADRTSAQRFMSKHGLVYHDYWLLGIMAIHAAFGEIQGYSVANKWSSLAGDDYDEDELLVRWDTITSPDYTPSLDIGQEITMSTYQWMFNESSIQWPRLKGKSKVPKPDELVNFKAFLKYKGLSPETDEMSRQPFLDGEDYALYPKYYLDKEAQYGIHYGDLERLSARLVEEAEPYNFLCTSSQVYSWLKDLVLLKDTKINRFAREIDSQALYDPSSEPDYIHEMATKIIQRNEEYEYPSQDFHNLLIRKWLLSLGRNLWSEGTMVSTSEGILILSSPMGGINKSSFGVRLFPPEWRHLHVTTIPRFGGVSEDKDSLQKTIGKMVVDFDEAETVFSHNDTASIKSYLTKEYDLFRPPYGKDSVRYDRFFSCMASTNLTDLVFPKEGVRRYWWLNVKYVDTYAMDKMNMYNLWRQIKHELAGSIYGKAPYLLEPEEAGYLEKYLTDHTTTNSTEEILYDWYDWSDDGFSMYTEIGRLKGIAKLSHSASEVLNDLPPQGAGVKQKALTHALTALLKRFAPSFNVSGHSIKNGMCTYRRQKRYFMPAKRNDALKRASRDI